MDLDDFLRGIGVHIEPGVENINNMNVGDDPDITQTTVTLFELNGSQPNGCRTEDDDSFQLSDTDLKPHPMVRKSRKQLTPEEQKDARYWHKRAKNNYAAKRSRESRRMRENQIVLRATYLEKENNSLKKCLKSLKEENEELRKLFH